MKIKIEGQYQTVHLDDWILYKKDKWKHWNLRHGKCNNLEDGQFPMKGKCSICGKPISTMVRAFFDLPDMYDAL